MQHSFLSTFLFPTSEYLGQKCLIAYAVLSEVAPNLKDCNELNQFTVKKSEHNEQREYQYVQLNKRCTHICILAVTYSLK